MEDDLGTADGGVERRAVAEVALDALVGIRHGSAPHQGAHRSILAAELVDDAQADGARGARDEDWGGHGGQSLVRQFSRPGGRRRRLFSGEETPPGAKRTPGYARPLTVLSARRSVLVAPAAGSRVHHWHQRRGDGSGRRTATRPTASARETVDRTAERWVRRACRTRLARR